METEILRSKKGKRVTLIGFAINTILTIIKIVTGFIGNSGAMIADGIHSLSDLLTDIVVIIGFKFTQQPEDKSHNYGHEKYETLTTVIIGVFLSIVAFEILKLGGEKIISVLSGTILPKPGYIALFAAVISIISKELLYRYTIKVAKNIMSAALSANAWHHRSDAFSSLGTLFGIGGAILLGEQWTILDPIASVIVSLFIFKVAFKILMPAINELLETSLSDEDRLRIESILLNHPQVKLYHNLRTRRFGSKAVIEMHVFVDSSLKIETAHDISSNIETSIKENFGQSTIITIHIEPYDENFRAP